MADYQLTDSADIVRRNVDKAYIPNDPANRDWVEYQAWLAGGGVPDPYVAPPAPETGPTPEQTVLYDHENRIRAQEGAPPLSIADFTAKSPP